MHEGLKQANENFCRAKTNWNPSVKAAILKVRKMFSGVYVISAEVAKGKSLAFYLSASIIQILAGCLKNLSSSSFHGGMTET